MSASRVHQRPENKLGFYNFLQQTTSEHPDSLDVVSEVEDVKHSRSCLRWSYKDDEGVV